MSKHLIIILFFLLPAVSFAQQDSLKKKLSDTLYMKEVVIVTKTAVRVHGDTTDYNVDSFNTDPLANTEDVLKRLPGVEISREGKITVNGKPVTKLFINGKEYLSDDLSGVIKNLPAEILEKIQVADFQDEDDKFTGSKDNSEEKAINLQMKKKFSGGVYGRANAGYGTKDRYQASAFANYMDDGPLQLTAMGGGGNTGTSDIGGDDGGDANSTSFARPGTSVARDATVGFSYEKKKKLTISGNYRYYSRDNYLTRSSFRTTYLPNDSLLLQQESNEQNSLSKGHTIYGRSKWDITENTSLSTRVYAKVAESENNRKGNDITYQDEVADVINFERANANTSQRDNNYYSIYNSVRHKFKKEGRRVYISANLKYSDADNVGEIRNLNSYYNPTSINSVDNRTEGANNHYTAIGNVYYTEPLGEKNKLIARYTYDYQYSDNENNVLVRNNDVYIQDTNQSRGFKNENADQTVGLTYQYNGDKLTSGVGFSAQPYSRTSVQTSGIGNDIEQRGTNYFPRVYSKYKFTKTSQLSFNYNGGIKQPTINQLQNVPNYTDSLNIYIGNPQLRPELNNGIRLRYGNANVKTGRNFWTSFAGTWVSNKIVNSTEITNSKRTTTPVNANGNYAADATVSHTEPIIKKILTTTGYLRGRWSNNVTITNNVLQNIGNYSIYTGIKVNSFSGKWYEGTVSYDYRWNKVQGATQQTQLVANNVFQTHDITHDGTFIFPKGIRFSYYLSYMVNKGLAQDFQQEFFLMNMMLNKTFSKPKGLSVRLHGFDVFNNYPTIQRNMSDNYYEDVEVNRLGSYFMLSIVYKFTSFPEKKNQDDDEE